MAQQFVSHRDVVIRSLKYGRSYAFKKGVPRDDVIPQMHQDLLNAGILPVDVDGKPSTAANVEIDETPPATTGKKIMLPPEDGDERKRQILEAIKQIVARNDSKDFTGGGSPKAAVVTDLLGWRVDQKDTSEVWKEHKAELVKP